MFGYRRAATRAQYIVRAVSSRGYSSSSSHSNSFYGCAAALSCFGLLAVNRSEGPIGCESGRKVYQYDESFNVSLVDEDEIAAPVANASSGEAEPAAPEQPEPVNWITAAQLAEMAEAGRVVVAFHNIVYDVTDFTGHPGGYGRLQMASGGDLAVFWKVYTQHNRGHIDYLLQRYKIGELSEEEARIVRERTVFENPYTNDPPTSPELLTNTRYPYNAEGRLSTLREKWLTPIGRHYIRNHCCVPDINPDEYRLTVEGAGMVETSFTLDQLKNDFPKVDVTTVIQCNGNRREDYHYIDGETPAFGPPHWVAGAIGNSTWSGARLRDVLKAAGMDVDAISLGKKPAPIESAQVGLLGYDHDEVGNQYCCSFPFEKAIDPYGDCIIAYEMNGQPIPRSHGYPVRAIVPGNAGARNCKFLERVTVTDKPCCEHCNWKQYAVHAPNTPLEELQDFEKFKADLVKDPSVQEMPVQSFITNPSAGDILGSCNGDFTEVKVKGIAWGGGGTGINRVDVSLDNGANFTRANLLENPVKQRRGSQWAWQFFEYNIPIPEDMREQLKRGEKVDLTLTSKALNTSWNVQPEHAAPNMNPHGCCVNHWYRVPVSLDPAISCDCKPAEDGEFGNKPSGGKFKTPFRNLDQPPEKRVVCYRSQKKCESNKCKTDCNSKNNDAKCDSECVVVECAVEAKDCGCDSL